MVHLSTEHWPGCWYFMTPSQTQLASPKRLMAHRPHLEPFISCFQNDISLATEDQQAWQEQRSSVSQQQNNTGQENMPRSRLAETDRPTMDPPHRHRGLLVRVKWTRGYLWPDLETECLQRSLAGVYCPPGASGWTTLHKRRLMIGPQ